jgi:hypothetical protein
MGGQGAMIGGGGMLRSGRGRGRGPQGDAASNFNPATSPCEGRVGR